MIRKSPVLLKIVEELQAVGQAIRLRHFPKGHLVIEQGTALGNVYVIKSGIVKCTYAEDIDKEYILAFLGEGETLGELEAICAMPALSGVRTISEVSVYAMDKGSFLELLGKHPALNAAVLELMALRLANTATRSARQQLHTLEYNLEQLMAVLEREKLPCSKQELAEYLGITLRSLNRLLKKRGGID